MARSKKTAEPLVPDKADLPDLRSAAAGCQACELWKTGTQTVFGEGAAQAEIMLVGEQPGDKEDLAGRPFVGPAGRLLDDALDEAGIDRSRAYVTNIVKHFQVGGARQAAHSQETRHDRDQRVQALARSRDKGG